MPAKKKPTDSIDIIIKASLFCATQMPWSHVTLADIAEESGLTLAELYSFARDKTDILVAYGRQLDQKVLKNIGTMSKDLPEKDRLFDVLMERFELLNDDRMALLSILNSLKEEPHDALISLPHIKHSMHWMLQAANVKTTGMRGIGKLCAITFVYLYTLRCWKKDTSADLSKTMATLDKALTRLLKFNS